VLFWQWVGLELPFLLWVVTHAAKLELLARARQCWQAGQPIEAAYLCALERTALLEQPALY